MQQDKISDLPELTAPDATDIMEITDVSASSSKHVKVSSLVAGLSDGSINGAKLTNNSVGMTKLALDTVLANVKNTTSVVIATTGGNVTVATASVTIPTGTSKLRIEGYIPNIGAGGAATGITRLWQGTTSGTQLQARNQKWQDVGDINGEYLYAIVESPTPGAATFTLSQSASANNLQLNLAATSPATLTVTVV